MANKAPLAVSTIIFAFLVIVFASVALGHGAPTWAAFYLVLGIATFIADLCFIILVPNELANRHDITKAEIYDAFFTLLGGLGAIASGVGVVKGYSTNSDAASLDVVDKLALPLSALLAILQAGVCVFLFQKCRHAKQNCPP